MPTEKGITWNPETARRETREKIMRLRHAGFEILLAADVPVYICDGLDSEDWDVIAQTVKTRMLEYFAKVGPMVGQALPTIKDKLAQLYRQEIYNRFADFQIRSGNEAWEVPESLQAHTLEKL